MLWCAPLLSQTMSSFPKYDTLSLWKNLIIISKPHYSFLVIIPLIYFLPLKSQENDSSCGKINLSLIQKCPKFGSGADPGPAADSMSPKTSPPFSTSRVEDGATLVPHECGLGMAFIQLYLDKFGLNLGYLLAWLTHVFICQHLLWFSLSLSIQLSGRKRMCLYN